MTLWMSVDLIKVLTSAKWLIKGWARLVFFKWCYIHLVQKPMRTLEVSRQNRGILHPILLYNSYSIVFYILNFNMLLLNNPMNFKGLSWHFMMVWLNIFIFIPNTFICSLSFIFLFPAVKIHWIHRSFSVSIAIHL